MKNILLFMTDQLRADFVGYAGKDDTLSTPNIDRIAAGCAFERCYTANPICTPARTALATGRYSRQIGTLTMSGDLFYQIPTFMQALQTAGYKTYGIGKFHYLQTFPWSTGRGCGIDLVAMTEQSRRFGYDFVWETAGKQMMNTSYCHYGKYLDDRNLLEAVRDFESACGGWNGDTPDHNWDKALPWPFAEEDYIDVVTGRVAREQLAQQDPSQPFYMMVSFCGPHKPYDAPQRYLDMFAEETDVELLPADNGLAPTPEEKKQLLRQRRSAKAMMKLIDDQIGLILGDLTEKGLLDDTLLVFVSDHGDMLGDHYRIQKGVPWEGAANVPLAIRAPGAAGGVRCGSVVELTDVTATILDYAGLDPQRALSRDWPAYNDRIPGRSLLPIVQGKTGAVREFAYCESDFTEERRPGTDPEAEIRKHGADGRRTNAWRAVVSADGKYVRYVDYAEERGAYEEFYDLAQDPGEQVNRIADPNRQAQIARARRRMEYVVDHYPAAQMTWATACAADRKKGDSK